MSSSAHAMEKKVSLMEYPTLCTQAVDPAREITLGDLHGNALKLVWFLIREGFVDTGENGMTEKKYLKLAKAWYMGNTTSFNEIIQDALHILPGTGTLRLIGDELADRGIDDSLTLCILEKLSESCSDSADEKQEKGVTDFHLEILFSNHSHFFFDWYSQVLEILEEKEAMDYIVDELLQDRQLMKRAKQYLGSPAWEMKRTNHLDSPALSLEQKIQLLALSKVPDSCFLSDPPQGKSLIRMVKKIDSWEKIEALDKQIKSIYSKKTFRLLSYTLTEDGGITIYTHAPFGIQSIRALAQHLKLSDTFRDDSPAGLAESIDKINAVFFRQMQSGKLLDKLEAQLLEQASTPDVYPLRGIIWNRYYGEEEEWAKEFPSTHAGYPIKFVHGHDMHKKYDQPHERHCRSIDNHFGKSHDAYKGSVNQLGYHKTVACKSALNDRDTSIRAASPK